MKRQTRRFQQAGLSLIEVLVIVAVLAVLTSVLLFSFARARRKASRIGCVNQLKNIGLAYRIFATDNDDSFPFQIAATNGGTLGFEHDIVKQFHALTNEFPTPQILICVTRTFARPRGPYSMETAASDWPALKPTNIDYFVNLDANESSPERILAGDNCV